MSDTTPGPADKRDGEGQDAPPVEPATAPAESAAAEPAPAASASTSASGDSSEPHDTDPDMTAPPSEPVSARGHINRPTDESAPATPAAAPPAAPAPAIEPEPVTASDDDVAAAVARTHAEPGATAAGDATVDTASPAQSAAPVIIAGAAAEHQAPATAPPAAPAAATAAYATQPGEATWAPEPAPAPPLAPQPVAPIFLQRPEPPKRKSNRGVGILIALVGTVLFAVLWALAVVVVGAMLTPSSDFVPALIQFFTHQFAAWAPIVAFFVGMVVLIQIVNRARWWAYILGGLVVAIFVYLSYIGASLIDVNFLGRNAQEQALFLRQAWVNPFAVLAGVIAREVSIWTGAWLAARGRKLKARNAEAQADYEQQVADAQNQAANAYAQQGY